MVWSRSDQSVPHSLEVEVKTACDKNNTRDQYTLRLVLLLRNCVLEPEILRHVLALDEHTTVLPFSARIYIDKK